MYTPSKGMYFNLEKWLIQKWQKAFFLVFSFLQIFTIVYKIAFNNKNKPLIALFISWFWNLDLSKACLQVWPLFSCLRMHQVPGCFCLLTSLIECIVRKRGQTTHCLDLDLNGKRPGVTFDTNFDSYLIGRSWYNHFRSFSMGENRGLD